MIFKKDENKLIEYPISEANVYLALQRKRIEKHDIYEELQDFGNKIIAYLNSIYVYARDRSRRDSIAFKTNMNKIKSLCCKELKQPTKMKILKKDFDIIPKYNKLPIAIYSWDKIYIKKYSDYINFDSGIYSNIIRKISNNKIPSFTKLTSMDFFNTVNCKTSEDVLKIINTYQYPNDLNVAIVILQNSIIEIKKMLSNISVSIEDAFIILDALSNYIITIYNIIETIYNKKMIIISGRLFITAESSMIINNLTSRFRLNEFKNICENSFNLESFDETINVDKQQQLKNLKAVIKYIDELYNSTMNIINNGERCYALLGRYPVTKDDLKLILTPIRDTKFESAIDFINKNINYDYTAMYRSEQAKIDLISIYSEKIKKIIDIDYSQIKNRLDELENNIINCKNMDYPSEMFKKHYKELGIYAYEEIDYLREQLKNSPYIAARIDRDMKYSDILYGNINYKRYGEVLHDLEQHSPEDVELMKKFFNTVTASYRFITLITPGDVKYTGLNNNLKISDELLADIIYFQIKCMRVRQ